MGENEKTYLDWEGLQEYHGKLETKLSEKANTEDLADVATSGDYNDLENTPTNVSQFTNDAGYMTSEIDNTNGHDYVEIGGIKWATMNLGARNITDIGLYFQWGDILGYTSEEVGEEKNFTWEDYKFNPSGDGTTFSKYNSTDLKTSLDTVDDAAASVWGSDWRVPSTSELQTLSNVVNVSWTNDYEDSGVPGLILTDKEDSSKVLFLPVTGVCSDGSIIDEDTTGFYWSKSLGNTDDKGLGLGFDKTDGTTWEYSNSRSLGFAIRPVLEGPAKRTIMGVTQQEKDKWNNSYSKEEIDEELESMELVTSTSLNDLNTRIGNTNTNLQNLENSIKYDNVLGTTISSAERTAWNAKVDGTSVGSANGVASLDSNGKVPSSQLPSYVDDVIEGYLYEGSFYKESAHETEIPGESGKIYVDLVTNKEYRWSGSQFTIVSETLALGETSSTAYRGDRGKIAYDHSQSTHARTDATKTEASETNGNIKINGEEITVYTHPGSGTNPHGTTKSDVGLGNVGNFKAVSTEASQGLSSEEQSNARANIGAGTSSFSGSYDDLTNKPTIPDAQIQSDWDQSDTNAKDFIKNKPTIPDAQIQSDWNQSDNTSKDFIKNKPGIGVANGLATLDSTGKVPSSQLPSYVDDVIEGYYHGEEDPQSGETVYNMYEDDEYTILITPESGKIYLDIPTSNSYRWSGSQYVLIGAPYDLPIASANTLGGIKVGDNLSIDQNGVLSAQASSPDEVQIGGDTPSSGSDIKIFIDTTEDSIAEVYTKQQQDGKFVIVKELNSAPTSSTLTYTENGTVKNFKQGDEVRVPDQDSDTGYTFYKLYKLTTSGNVTTAEWDVLGAGNEEVPEVQIGGNTPSSDSEVKIFIDENADDTIEVYTKAQAKGEFVVIVNSNSEPTSSTLTYTSVDGTTKNFKVGDEIRVPDAEADNGYIFYKLYALTTEEGVTTATWDKLGAGGAPVNPNETVNISISCFGNTSDLIGATITAINDSTSETITYGTWNGTTISLEIPHAIQYRISFGNITGYKSPSDQKYFSTGGYNRTVSAQYILNNGVYIESTEGKFYTRQLWDNTKTANSIDIISDNYKGRFALNISAQGMTFDANNQTVRYVMETTSSEASAKVDMQGKTKTNAVIARNASYATDTSQIWGYCNTYSFPNGRKGYVPACGELWIAYQNKVEINNCLTTLGKTAISSKIISSTYNGSDSANWEHMWTVNFSDGTVNNGGYDTDRCAWPVDSFD